MDRKTLGELWGTQPSPYERLPIEGPDLRGYDDIRFYASCFRAKSFGYLCNAGFTTIAQVTTKTRTEILSICNYEKETVKDIEGVLACFGFSFKPES